MPGFSLLYSWRYLFHLQMRLEYGRYFRARYEAIARLIPEGSRVVDVCAGDCLLYLEHLKQKGVDYIGLDVSRAMIRWAVRRGVDARVFNFWEEELPRADIVLMQSSLYQFAPQTEWAVGKLLSAARQHVIITEGVHNVTNSSIPLVGRLAGFLTRPAGRKASYTGERFNEKTLTELFESCGGLESSFLIPGGRELVGIFKGTAQA